ncbi:hypothetical protein [Ferruginibacter albus]|uniref:hypothetical protein n=1 Tax=Ferruginibacter albus TaxID=2875540 RepID=UPI001CC7B4AD|nr:hypothetical protein [Ferruginibacter albus]UAY51013.1 hypothetical protein K9M53_10475 [Ferruginibacter albus]
MLAYIYRAKFVIALLVAGALLLTSCYKAPVNPDPQLQNYFKQEVLDKNFVVTLATDSGVDITSAYAKDTFVMKGTTDTSYNNGPMIAHTDAGIFTGTWSSNTNGYFDYSILTIDFDAPYPDNFKFFIRPWKFTSKADFPTLHLAPYGVSTDPKVLTMQRL